MRHTENKEQNGRCKSNHINNYMKCQRNICSKLKGGHLTGLKQTNKQKPRSYRMCFSALQKTRIREWEDELQNWKQYLQITYG